MLASFWNAPYMGSWGRRAAISNRLASRNQPPAAASPRTTTTACERRCHARLPNTPRLQRLIGEPRQRMIHSRKIHKTDIGCLARSGRADSEEPTCLWINENGFARTTWIRPSPCADPTASMSSRWRVLAQVEFLSRCAPYFGQLTPSYYQNSSS